MESDFVKVYNLFFELADVKIKGKNLKDYFNYESQSFWWSLGDLFFTKLGKKGWELKKENILYHWKKFLFYNDVRVNKVQSLPDCDCVFFNLGLQRSTKSVGTNLLSNQLKNLEPQLKNNRIRYVEMTDVDSESYSKLNPYNLFNYRVTYPMNSVVDDKIKRLESAESKKIQNMWFGIRDEVGSVLPELYKNMDLDVEVVLRTLDLSISRAYPEAIRCYSSLVKVLEQTKAKVLYLIGLEDRLNIAAMLAAKKKKVKTISVHHGLIPSHPKYHRDFPMPDFICVDGRREFSRLKNIGVTNSQIVVTGHPRYDGLVDFVQRNDADELRKKYGLPYNKKIILWATQTHAPQISRTGEAQIMAKKVFHVFKQYPQFNLVIKLHPNEDQSASIYKKMAKKMGLTIKVYGKNAVTNELILLSDAVIMKISTVGVDAILIGKPIVMLEFVKSVDLSEFSRYGFTVVSNEDELIDFLQTLENKEQIENFNRIRKNFIEDRAANFGNASEKVTELIVNIIKTYPEE
jgi:uncharacterized protein (UPF0218 family)